MPGDSAPGARQARTVHWTVRVRALSPGPRCARPSSSTSVGGCPPPLACHRLGIRRSKTNPVIGRGRWVPLTVSKGGGMDWQALALSLELAAATLLVLLPAGLWLGRWLANTRFAGKSWIEAVVVLPLVLPPTVLGYYLLVSLGGASPAGRVAAADVRRAADLQLPGLLVASVIFNIPFMVQPVQRAFEAIPRQPGRGRGRQRAVGLADLLARRAAAGLAGRAVGLRADLRAHPGRVRRGADGGRQHPGRDQDHRHCHLRPRAVLRPGRRQPDGVAAAGVLAAGGGRVVLRVGKLALRR
jgi:hypothetical protein